MAGQINAAYAQTTQVAGNNARQFRQIQDEFRNSVRGIGGFQIESMQVESYTRQMTRALDMQKVGLRDLRGAWRETNNIMREQLRLQDAVAVSWTKTGSGIIQGELITPLHDYESALRRVNMRLGIHGTIINSVGANMVNWGKNMQWTGRQLTVGLTYPLGLASAALGKLAYDLDRELVRMEKVYGDLGTTSEHELGRARAATIETARDVAKNFGVAAEDTANLAAEFAAIGLQGQELQDTVAETSRIMVLGEIDRQTAIEGTISIQKVWDKSTAELTDSFNRLNAIENATAISTDQLLQGIPRAAGAFQTAGGSVEQLAAALAGMNERGVTDAPQAARAIRASIGRIADPSRKVIKMFDEIGFSIEDLDARNIGNISGQFEELAALFANLDEQQRTNLGQELFGLDQYSRMLSLMDAINDKSSAYHKSLEVMGRTATEVANTADAEVQRIIESPSGRLRSIVAQLKLEFAEMGQPVLEGVNFVLDKILTLVQNFRSLPGSVKLALAAIGGITAIAGPIIMLTGLLANLFGSGISGFGKMMVMVAKLTGSFKRIEDAEGRFAQLVRNVATPAVVDQQKAMAALGAQIDKASNSLAVLASRQKGLTPIMAQGQLTTLNRGQLGPVTPFGARQPAAAAATPATPTNRGDKLATAAMSTGMIAGTMGILLGSTSAWVNTLGTAAFTLGMMVPLMSKIAQSAVVLNTVGAIGNSRALTGTIGRFKSLQGFLKGSVGAIRSMLPLLGAVGGAIGVAALAALALHNNAKNAAKQYESLNNAAQSMAEVNGVAWNEYGSQVDESGNKIKSATDKVKEFREANADVVELIKSASGGRALDMARQIGFDYYAGTGDARGALEAAENALRAAGRTDLVAEINVNFSIDEERVREQGRMMGREVRRILNDEFDQGFGEGAIRLFGNNLSESAQVAAVGAGDRIADAMFRGIEKKDFSEAEENIKSTMSSFASEALAVFEKANIDITEEMERTAKEVANIDISNEEGLTDFLLAATDEQRFQVFGNQIGAMGRELNTARDAYAKYIEGVMQSNIVNEDQIDGMITLRNILGQVQSTVFDLSDAEAQYAAVRRSLRSSLESSSPAIVEAANQRLLSTLNQLRERMGLVPTTDLADGFKEVGSAAKAAGNDVEETADVVEDAADRYADYAKTFRSNIEQNVGNAVGVIMSQFDDQTEALQDSLSEQEDAESDALQNRQKANEKYFENLAKQQDDAYEALVESTESYYENLIKTEEEAADAAVKRIEDQIDAEEKAERLRQENFEAERRRIQRLAETANSEIDYNVAVRSGNLDEAARIQTAMSSRNAEWNIEDSTRAMEKQAEERRELQRSDIERIKTDSEARIEGYRNELDVRKDTLEQERELERDRLEMAKENAKARFDAESDQINKVYELRRNTLAKNREDLRYTLETDLARLTQSVPQTANEYNGLMNLLEQRYAHHTGVALQKNNEWRDNFIHGFRGAFDGAIAAIRNESAWESVGQAAMDGISKSMFGMSFDQVIGYLNTGTVPGGTTPTAAASTLRGNGRMAVNPTGGFREYHTGGPIEGSSAPGLKPDEVPIIAQRGEYMMDRDTVDRYGEGFFRGLQSNGIRPGMDDTGRMHSGGVVPPITGFAYDAAKMVFANLLKSAVQRKDDELIMAGTAPGETLAGGTGLVTGQLSGVADIESILRGLRLHESGGNYRARSRISSAAGAYQYLKGTWRNFGGYATADLAPPALQDARARADLQAAYNRYGDWEKAVAAHFYPAWANNKSMWNRSPSPGNPTVRSYVDSVLSKAGVNLAMGFGLPNAIMGTGLRAPDRFAPYMTAQQRAVNADVMQVGGAILGAIPGQQTITSGVRPGAKIRGTNKPSLHASARALDIGILARNRGGTAATEATGDRIAHMFRTMTNASEVLWKTMQGGDHFNHVHAGFRNGARLTVPSLAVGGTVNYDDTLANLHKNETVLTAPLSQKLEKGIDKIDSGGTNMYNININIPDGQSPDQIANAIMRRIEQKETKIGRKRTI